MRYDSPRARRHRPLPREPMPLPSSPFLLLIPGPRSVVLPRTFSFFLGPSQVSVADDPPEGLQTLQCERPMPPR